MSPNFFLVGAPKSGTSVLWAFLSRHPEVEMSSFKEPHYLMYLAEGRPSWAIKKEEDYLALWRNPDLKVHGEASTNYLCSPGVPSVLYSHYPSAKIVAILRQPVDRAWSAYLFKKTHTWEPYERCSTFEAALASEPLRQKSGVMYDLLYRYVGLYANQVRRYQDFFAPEQLRFYLYEDLIQRPSWLWKDLLAFLEVDQSVPWPGGERVNASFAVKSQMTHEFISRRWRGKEIVKAVLPKRLRSALKEKIMRVNKKPAPRLEPAQRAALTETFRDDIKQLEQLIGRDLSVWLQSSHGGQEA